MTLFLCLLSRTWHCGDLSTLGFPRSFSVAAKRAGRCVNAPPLAPHYLQMCM